MSEHAFTETETDDGAPPPPVMTSTKPPPVDEAPAGKPRRGERTQSVSQRAAFREILISEDQNLRDVIEQFGPNGSFKIAIKRIEPETAMVKGVRQTIAGHIETINNKPIDEDWLRDHYAGGKYELKFMAPRPETGKMGYAGTKYVEISGKPNLAAHGFEEDSGPATPAPNTPTEATGTVNKMFDIMAENLKSSQERLDRERERPLLSAPSSDPTLTAAMAMVERQNQSMAAEMTAMRQELVAARNQKPPEDDFKNKFLDKLVDGDSARVNAVREQLMSELRQQKEYGIETERRLRDELARRESELNNRHEREIANLKQSHELTIATMKQSHEMTVMTMKQSHELSIAAARGSFETQAKLVEGENRRLERDVSELRVETKELRAKKEKTLIESLKEVEVVKKALDMDGDSEPKSAFSTLAEAAANPEVWAMVGQHFGKKEEAPKQPVQQQPKQDTFRDTDGKYYKVVDGQLVPLKKNKKVKPKPRPAPAQAATGEAGGEAPAEGAAAQAEEPEVVEETDDEIPEIPEERLRVLISVLESSVGKQPPEIVAQGLRTQIPNEAIEWLSGKVTEIGVNKTVQMFFSKVAPLGAGSPLSTQDGRNWARAFVRALVGGD